MVLRVDLHDGQTSGSGLDAVARRVLDAVRVVALTGAGISVESGIPDFRSPEGLWSRFDPMEYATLTCFLRDPDKAWKLYRALGSTLAQARPNPAHRALARLEEAGRLAGVVTQNVDGLHRAAGSRNVLAIHGDAASLRCPGCGRIEPLLPEHLEPGPAPTCRACGRAVKPDLVLFEEPVRAMPAIVRLLAGCDLLLVVGTSTEVAPAGLLADGIVARGGDLVEFNVQPTRRTREGLGPGGALVLGPAGVTVPRVVDRVLELASGEGSA